MRGKLKNLLDRRTGPHFKEAEAFCLELPPYQKHILANGVEVCAVNRGKVDALMVNWIFNAGNSFETKSGLARATNALLTSGTFLRSQLDINRQFEYVGASLDLSCRHETASITLHCLNRHVGELLPIVAELLTGSVFPSDELALYKRNAQQRLQVKLKESNYLADRLLNSCLYGQSHPYSRYSSGEEYGALEQEDLIEFFRQHYHNGSCRIIVAGKLPGDLVEQLENSFGSLPLHGPVQFYDMPVFPILPAEKKKYKINNDPGGVQASIRIARNFPNTRHPDFLKISMLLVVFGGYFGSRLMANIREEKGYAYDISSYLLSYIQGSALVISTEAGKEVCRATIKEIYKEMNLLRKIPIGKEELQEARNFAIGNIMGELDGPFNVAEGWNNIFQNGLEDDYFSRQIHIIKTITPGELQELANKYLDPSAFFEIVVV